MKKLKNIFFILTAIIIGEKITAQDPSFSQYFSSPLNINPALTANINEKWRLITNYRNQWIGPANPYQNGTISFDSKIFQNTGDNYIDENTRVGMGGMLMFDQAFAGAFKSNYASFNITGNIRLANNQGSDYYGNRIRHQSKIKMEQSAEQRLGVGIGVIYGHKRIDFSHLRFGEQFTGTGFNTSLPTGETSLSNMKPYLSASAGLIYSFITEKINVDLGVSAFHFNKPKQTFLADKNQYLATRYVIHSNVEALLTDNVVLNTNGIYQYQSGASYFSIGGSLGYYLPGDNEKERLINAGLWYWSNNAVIPYIGFSNGNFQVGLTYGVTISKLNEAPKRSHTFEVSMVFRGKGNGKSDGVIPAPWK